MRWQEILESSGYSLQGSWTPDLVFSKLWICRELDNILDGHTVPVAYVLGSWYSNLSIIMRRCGLPIHTIINVDAQKQWLDTGKTITDAMQLSDIQHMRANANELDYQQMQTPGLVINTSLTDMPGQTWFDRIPNGTLVVLQARDHDPGEQYHSINDILARFPLRQLYQGSMRLRDPETVYTRYMVIGVKSRDQLHELSFLGSPCTVDCSGHRAGYQWSQQRGGQIAKSWSSSFNKGAALQRAGK